MKEEKGKWEDVIRSKIYHFEAETNSDDWDIISGKLPKGKTVMFSSYRRSGYAAAAVAAILVIGSLYFYLYDNKGIETTAVVEKPVEKVLESVENVVDNSLRVVEKPVDKLFKAEVKSGSNFSKAALNKAEESLIQLQALFPDEIYLDIIPDIDVEAIEKDLLFGFNELKPEVVFLDNSHFADASSETKRRRWGFGMGGGGYTAGSISGASGVGPYSTALSIDEYLFSKESIRLQNFGQGRILYDSSDDGKANSEFTPGKITHKTPISVGFGVSYYLNDRWALQSGVVYTLLRSEGNSYNEVDEVKWKQNLHFVGVPLSLTYKIAEWNRFQFYASAGGMCEFNVSGKLKNTISVDNAKIIETENLRMKAPLWSVNARGGVAYPLCKFISAYVEAGTSYYLSNNSKIETIRSDKPFNVSLQAGVRLSF